jgi:hypothetical protein
VDVDEWLAALEDRHLSDLTPSEVARALRALSSCYVERREKLTTGAALEGAGKRAAFALFYGPQHFLITREIVVRLGIAPGSYGHVIDVGCGTGAAGIAAALQCGARSIEGLDVNPWAAREANWTYSAFGLDGRAAVVNVARSRIRVRPDALILGAYAVNELPESVRDGVLEQFVAAHRRGAGVLIVEPIGRRVNRWWTDWAKVFGEAGGRNDDWRFPLRLPARQRALARAAGLDVQELTARSLYLPQIPSADRE